MIPPTRPTIRFHKWRTAKRNFINQIALPGLKYGKMPAPRDLQILFDFPHEPAGAVSRVSTPAGATTAPQHVLSASDTARMEEWANTHGANANSSKAPGALTASTPLPTCELCEVRQASVELRACRDGPPALMSTLPDGKYGRVRSGLAAEFRQCGARHCVTSKWCALEIREGL